MPNVKLMPDYFCWPLWMLPPDSSGALDPDDLPLSEGLKNDLWQWAAIYDSWLNMSDPANSPAVPDAEELRFERAGIDLWRRVAKELGMGYRVSYFSSRYNREFTDESAIPEELR